jgi:8-oxo-dGTP diphosphatase
VSASARAPKCSVAAIVRRDPGGAEFLAVLRPPDDDRLPDVWGLPAVSLLPGELPEAGLRRVGREKLGVELEPVSMLGIRRADRGQYELILMDIEARLVSGEPSVHRASSTATRYADQRWTDDLQLLAPAASRGSLCCRILLDSAGVPYTV